MNRYNENQPKPGPIQMKPQTGKPIRSKQFSPYHPGSNPSLLDHYSAIGNQAAQRLHNPNKPNGIPEPVRTQMENALQTDFSDVSITPNSSKASQMEALAYTQGNKIHFAPGMYNPSSQTGMKLLGHELTHVIQQREGRVNVTHRFNGNPLNMNPLLENEADHLGNTAVNSRVHLTQPGTPGISPHPSSPISTPGSEHVSSTPIQGSLTHPMYSNINDLRDFNSLPDRSGSKMNTTPDNSHPLQLKGATPDETRQKGAEKAIDLFNPNAGLKNLNESGEKSKTPNMETGTQKKEIISEKADESNELIDKAIKKSEDNIELEGMLQVIKSYMGLEAIEMVNLGTPNAAIRFKVNPWFAHQIPSGQLYYQMLGTQNPTPISKVTLETEQLTIGPQTCEVGKHMVADPLAPDHEPGSQSSNDHDQDNLMKELANSGNTGVPNDQKYIKGHLLNDNIGGQGAAFNLFPITADANAKHLTYVEKFVKSQLQGHYVVYYEIMVDHQNPVSLNGNGAKPFKIDSEFKFYWHLLDATGKQIKNAHQGSIESTFNTKGAAPFNVTTEYANEYNQLNLGKTTPGAIQQPGQWQEPTLSSPAMQHTGTPTNLAAFSLNIGHYGSSAVDLTGKIIHMDPKSTVEYISVRTPNVPPGLMNGSTISVGPSTAPVTKAVSQISPVGGGWTRIYFI